MRKRPGEVRDAIVRVLEARPRGASVAEITQQVTALIGDVPASSVRSYLQLNTPQLFARMDRAQYMLNGFSFQTAVTSHKTQIRSYRTGKATLFHDDCLSWLERQQFNSVHAVVTDPPYGLIEYSELEQRKLRAQVRSMMGHFRRCQGYRHSSSTFQISSNLSESITITSTSENAENGVPNVSGETLYPNLALPTIARFSCGSESLSCKWVISRW